MSLVQAAGFRINCLTALHALRDRANIAPSERLLVIGAAGGVGSAAIQVGKVLRAEVIACVSSEPRRDFVKSLGADHTIVSQREGWRERLQRRRP